MRLALFYIFCYYQQTPRRKIVLFCLWTFSGLTCSCWTHKSLKTFHKYIESLPLSLFFLKYSRSKTNKTTRKTEKRKCSFLFCFFLIKITETRANFAFLGTYAGVCFFMSCFQNNSQVSMLLVVLLFILLFSKPVDSPFPLKEKKDTLRSESRDESSDVWACKQALKASRHSVGAPTGMQPRRFKSG